VGATVSAVVVMMSTAAGPAIPGALSGASSPSLEHAPSSSTPAAANVTRLRIGTA